MDMKVEGLYNTGPARPESRPVESRCPSPTLVIPRPRARSSTAANTPGIAHHATPDDAYPRTAATPRRSLPSTIPSAVSLTETGVLIACQSLTRSVAFYAQLTGRDIPIRGDKARIGPPVLVQQLTTDTPIDASSVILQIVVDNPAEVRLRLGADIDSTADSIETIEVRDPDGRTVRVSQRPPV